MRRASRTAVLIAIAILLSGCGLIGAKVLSPDDIAEAAQLIEAAGGSGCAWLRGEAKPPAASVDLDFIYSWGDVSYLDCIKTIRGQ